jgi:hypothetical protein
MLSRVSLPPLGSLVPIRDFEAEGEAQMICRDDFWAGMITKRSRVFRQDNDAKSAKHIMKYLVNKKRLVTLKIQIEMGDDKKPLDHTDAGGEVDRQLAA